MNQHDDGGDTLPERSGEEEHAYLLGRAEAHRRLAEEAQQSETRLIHLRLQQLYTARANLIDLVDTN